MANFYTFLPLLKKVEAGFQKLTKDSGNYNSLGQLVGTNWGISAKTYESWIKRVPTEQDMRTMPQSVANAIYKAWYWNPLSADSIKNQSVANLIVDHGVNAGVGTAAKMTQKAINKYGYNLTIDGKIGPKTIAALNAINQESLHETIKQARVDYYKSLGGSFLNGWLNRLDSFFFESNTVKILGTFFFAVAGFLIYKKIKK